MALLAALAVALGSAPARADAQSPEATFALGADALERGEFGTAIDLFEALADQGYVHPDASFDRGLAYVMRARARADRPGDLGRAAAGFEEALRLRPDDHQADVALDLVRAEVTRRRSRHAKELVDARPTLDRVLVGLASEQTWAASALVASLLLAAGLLLRRRAGRAHVTGSVLAPTALLALLVLAPLAWGARWTRLNAHPGVVVVPELHLTDEDGKPVAGGILPEAAAVEVGERRAELAHVRWGGAEGWAPAGSVRLLSP